MSIKKVLFFTVTCLLLFCFCNDAVGPAIPNISGGYDMTYQYTFQWQNFTMDVDDEQGGFVLTQRGNAIRLDNCRGKFISSQDIILRGFLLTTGGVQNFKGTYNATYRTISGTFTGTVEEHASDNQPHLGDVINGKFTLTQINDTLP